MVQRVQYRRHNHYHTRSNKTKLVRVSGGRLSVHYVKKKARRPKCADCKNPLHGIKALRPAENRRAPKKYRTVARAYGGSVCASCVRERIMRAFLFEEQKCVKQVLKEKKRQEKKMQNVKDDKGDKKKKDGAGEKKQAPKKEKKKTTQKK